MSQFLIDEVNVSKTPQYWQKKRFLDLVDIGDMVSTTRIYVFFKNPICQKANLRFP